MSDARQARLLEQHFDAACELSTAERESFLDEIGEGDPALADELRALLTADEAESSVLEETAWDRLRTAEAPAEVAPFSPGRELAGYSIVRRIASGGMGHVYEARQARPERRVALKVLRLGLADERARRRFEFEAELLGKLEHPAIARIYEVGTLSDEDERLPFFAMEFVEGARSITEYAVEEGLDLPARVRLFHAACTGVRHGHQRRIIHRDLKPANLLVDRTGAVKVIDFGVARADDAESRDAAGFTHDGQLLGTPAWMSPEQCAGTPADLDTTTDVYSLGVVLFELLTDQLPIVVEGLSLTEAVRRVREEEPDLRALRGLPRDLQAILARCLEKDPARRYPSAGELVAELDRYLDHRPVEARPPSALYQLSKLARRHRKAVAAAGAVVLALAIGLVATTLQTRRAVRAEGLAKERLSEVERESEKLARIRGFLEEVITAARPVYSLGQDLTVREVVTVAVERARFELADDPEVLLPVLTTLGEALMDLGDYEEALDLLEDAQGPAREILESTDPLRLRIDVAIGHLRHGLGDPRAAFDLFEPIAIALEQRGAPPEDRAEAWERLGFAQRDLDRPQDAYASQEKALALRTEALGEDSLLVGHSLYHLSVLDFEARELERAEERQRRAIELAELHLVENHPWRPTVYHGLASTLRAKGKFAEAVDWWTRALAIQDEVLDRDHPMRMTTLSNLAAALVDLGEYARAERMLVEALAVRRRTLGDTSGQVASTLRELGRLATRLGKNDEAESRYREAIEIHRENNASRGIEGSEARELGLALQSLAVLRMRAERLSEAEEFAREAIDVQREALAEGHPDLSGSLSLLGVLQVRQGRAAEAQPSLEEALAARRINPGPDHWMTANTRSVLGECLLAQDRVDDAREHLEGALTVLEATLTEGHPLLQDARARVEVLRERTEGDAP